ncbi:MAG: LysR family transcriptional regulator [Hyphomicrobiales bacterium]
MKPWGMRCPWAGLALHKGRRRAVARRNRSAEGCNSAGSPNNPVMNWDDLRIAMAVYQTGSYSAAGTRLRIDETTVARRLSRLQRDLGVQLFEAVDGARRPTAQCRDILTHAKRMADHAERIASVGEGVEHRVGTYRIATTDSIAVEVLAPNVANVLAGNAGLTLHFLASTENVDFSRWEADLALRLKKPDKGDFIISKIFDLSFYLFEPADTPASDREPLLCAYPEDLDMSPESRFLIETGRKDAARCVTKNLIVVKKLIESRRCGGVLPEFMCAGLLDDDRFTVTKLPEPRGVWLLMQPHLKGDRTARMLVEWIKESFSALERGAP